MQILIIAAIICLALSFFADRGKTIAGIKRGGVMLLRILPALLLVVFLVSIFIYLVPEKVITGYLGSNSGAMGIVAAALIGSVSLIPGFVAFPLAGILISKGVSYTVVAVFITSLMMVGTLTLPLEIKYFGRKAAIMRNVLSFFGAIIIGLLMGVFF
ncbi:hypothetical protein A2276_04300 [candidate division WOR-1 bacterium RIFOXYA12_FULL_43_27]|uniref:Permease n=1 Tax=candidate division WOR-1 bacterium RIFOXYC2_FULL_46_14 TaxID=1802587 RepID=A0A1F4U372_UNCSA|nr:MAG: hypothetical protein A2276_04300 [candidate division WOR-1 bacterium RIFOXYA12_FULL_43_27]OGC19088.1 MAG: hypothetical protein A2292_00035 [candidate division WOR-1 bacterium RIFOXYB2_FULL_46_45]OGC30076.1 MAG: hypothetical protein A2232_00035 [candidate division WOR-1 bacterium RIFOXYA2_FULL_46_56]OGC39317.1 MAG: hypothetical protein A2438_00035 [candidate division WOR-1 bacterium RIFOXYC2_FULL_46_14]